MRILLVFIALFFATQAFAVGSPDYLPDGPHPRIWLTPSLITELKAKRTANTADWQALIAREGVFTAYINNQPYRLDWPGGAGYAGSGYQDALMTWGILYHSYKTSAYGTGSEVADDVTARGYAQKAVNMLNAIIGYYSTGEEQDGIDLIRMNDRLYNFNSAEYAINAARTGTTALSYLAGQNRLLTYKNGYSARTTAMVLPVIYDWLYNDPLLTTELKTTLYKIMYRHIDWARGVRSTYNNGILIAGTRYHEDTDGDCTGINDCTINDTSDNLARRQKGYSYGWIGANFHEGFVGSAMLAAVAVYGDPPQADADAYLTYAKGLWTEHQASLTSDTGYKGGDSPEGVYYNSSWNNLLNGVLGLKTATGMDVFANFDFPKEMAKNLVHNAYPSLTKMLHRGAWSSSSSSQWMTPVAQSLNIVSHILRDYYGEPDEGKVLQQYFNTATIVSQGQAWEKVLWRNDANAATKALNTEPLYYRAIGTGVVSLRSSWANAMDSVIAQVNLKGHNRLDHESYDAGHILLSRGADRLLSRMKLTNITDDETVQGQNSIVFNNTTPVYAPLSDDMDRTTTLTAPAIDREEHGTGYDYIRGEMSNAYKYSQGGTDLAKLFYRSVLYLRPNIMVVYDITRSNPAVGNTKSWYMQLEAAPTIDTENRLVSATVGSSKVFIKGLYPSTGTYTDSDLSSQSHASVAPVFHRVKYEAATQQEYEQFLHVIEATGSGNSQTSSSLIDCSNMRGMQMLNNIVMFGKDQSGSGPTGTITYNYTGSSQSIHYLMLTPNSGYNIAVSGSIHKTITLVPDTTSETKVSANGILVLAVNDSSNLVSIQNNITVPDTSKPTIRIIRSL